jgi:alpha-L-rhamnosidase
MRKLGYLTVLLVLAATRLAACAAPDAAGQGAGVPSAPLALSVEYAAQPLGIDTARPRLAWQLPAGFGGGPQAAYRIRVAAAPEAFDSAPLWDSGKVDSAESTQIAYTGPALGARARYWWQVQVWDEQGRASAWSAPSWWEMGLLAPGDWSARWISGRQTLDHRWRDGRFSFDFSLMGKAVGFLFRARPVGKTYGEAYLWQVESENGQTRLVEQQRSYAGGNSSKVSVNTLRTVPLPTAPPDWAAQRHTLVIEARGPDLITSLDGVIVDRLQDADSVAGAIGMIAAQADAAVIHSVRVESAEGDFHTDFAGGANPFTGGEVGPDGLRVAAGVPDKDLVLPIDAPAPLLRREFAVESQPLSARLYVAAGGFPKINLNGEPLGEAIADGYTDYGKTVLYRSFDVTSLLHSGANVLGVELGRGWYGVTEPDEWYWHMAPWHAAPTLRAQLEISYADGRHLTVASDGGWRSADGPTLHDSIYGGERYDARRLPARWLEPGFDDRSWAPAVLVPGPRGALRAAAQEPIGVSGEIKPVGLSQPRPGVWVYDFGRIFAGRLRLNVSGPAGTTVTLVQTEKLNDDGTVAVASGLVDTQLQTDQYSLAGSGEEQWRPSFSYKGFRYVQVSNWPGTPTLDSLTGEVMHSSVASAGEFDSSDALLNQIQAAARATLQNNMFGNQTDTPTYEKNGWTGDAQASSLASILNFGVARVWSKWLGDFRDAQAPSGEMPKIVPSTPYYGYDQSPGWKMMWGPVPPWDAATYVLPWEMYQSLGDRRILEQMYEAQKKLADFTAKYFPPEDYAYTNPNNPYLGEYAAPLPPGGILAAMMLMPAGPADATNSAYWYHMLDLLARSAELLGRTEDAVNYRALADRVREAYNRRYWDGDAEIYRALGPGGAARPYAQTPNVLAVAFGLVPAGHEDAVVRHLNEDIVAKDYHLMTTGVYAGRYVLTMLCDHGYADTAYTVATRTDEPSWGFWIKSGLSTMAEGWALSSRSWDHHYWASISSYFYQGLTGLRPAAPGYRRLLVRPSVPAGLDWVRASVDTPYGKAESGWKKSAQSLALNVRVPAGVTAEIWAPSGGSRPEREPAGAAFLRMQGNCAVYAAGGGDYEFKLPLPAQPQC